MNIAIVYDSRTGITAAAARAMGKTLTERGHACTIESVAEADPARAAGADLICVGSWTKGLFVILQHPTDESLRFIDRLGLAGKRALVFCTYKLATGSTLPRMARAMERRGAHVIGQFKFRGPSVTREFEAFARTL